MEKTLILFAFKGIVLDSYSRISGDLDDIRSVAKDLDEQGHVISPNSRYPLQYLQSWAETLLLNGPLIAENGAVIKYSRGILKDWMYVTYEKGRIFWPYLRSSIAEFLTLQGYVTSSTHHYNQKVKVDNLGIVGSNCVVFNSHILHGLYYYVGRVKKDGYLQVDIDLFNQVNVAIQQKFPQLKGCEFNFDNKHAICSVTMPDVNKASSIPKLRQRFPKHRIVMIGANVEDAVLKGQVDILIAVDNAPKELKDVADIVTKQSYARGLLEAIRSLN